MDQSNDGLDIDRRRLLQAVSLGAGALALVDGAPRSATAASAQVSGASSTMPKVRTITAFTSISAQNYRKQIRSAVDFLNHVRESIKSIGYDVMTIRIVTQPFPEYTRDLSHSEAMNLIKGINDLATELGFSPNIGPVMSTDAEASPPVELLVDFLSSPGNLCNANIIVADKDGIAWNAVRRAGEIMRQLSTQSTRGLGNFNFAAIAMMKPFGPFYPGAWHPGSAANSFAVGLQSANVVMDAFTQDRNPATAGALLSQMLAGHAEKIEQAVKRHDREAGWIYAGIDPTPAPLGGVSIGAAIEAFLGAPFGSPGTETACGIITRAVQSAPVKQTGYSGLMLPILEDDTLRRRWTEGTYGLDSIMAYSAVCAGGVDTAPFAGSTTAETLSRVVGDVATLAFKWNKPLAARLLPAAGRKVGERTAFSGGALDDAIIQPLGGSSRPL